MKNLVLIIGVISLVVCILSLLFSAFNWYGYHHVLDGTSELYIRLRQRMIISLVIGLVFGGIGIASLIIRFKVLCN